MRATTTGTTRIVLTGGPGAGKTVVCQALAQVLAGRVVVVPEAATQVYQRLNTRWDRLDVIGRRDVQRRIYQLQIEQEQRIAREQPGKVLLLDRGTVDGSAYWPAGPEDYWRELGTSRQQELSRYAAVIWLESCAAIGGLYDREGSNAFRCESPAEALELGRLQRRVWSGHPQLHEVPAFPTLEEKIAAVQRIIGRFIAEGDHPHGP